MTAAPVVDTTDPLVVFIAWALTSVAAKVFKSQEKLNGFRHVLPALAVLIAVGARAAIDSSVGEALTLESFLRALAAGAVAVLTHAQVREAQKFRAKKREK